MKDVQNYWFKGKILEKKREYIETVHQLFVNFKEAYDSARREVLYNILLEFGLSMKQAD
jgi:16S rRNA C1402 N4-methylase RsmH